MGTSNHNRSEVLSQAGGSRLDLLPLSLINDYFYCQRRAALKLIEGSREGNEHTARGDIVHEHSDLAGYEVVKGVTLLRALPVWSDRLGLNGKCDIVEQHPDGELRPVEFKLGKRRQWINDDAQLCAQAFCLEELFQRPVARGAVFHADSKRRRELEFSAELRAVVEQAAAALHGLSSAAAAWQGARLPAAVFKPACEECTLYPICLPQLTAQPAKLARARKELYET